MTNTVGFSPTSKVLLGHRMRSLSFERQHNGKATTQENPEDSESPVISSEPDPMESALVAVRGHRSDASIWHDTEMELGFRDDGKKMLPEVWPPDGLIGASLCCLLL
jgi:hypothetical protein